MGVTVEVIFWGLIALAPDQQPPVEMFALLADPPAVQGPHDQHTVPEHAARVWLLKGECTGDCERAPQHIIEMAEKARPPLPHPLVLMGSKDDFPLRWWLYKEHLQFAGGVTGVNLVRSGRPTLLGRPVRLPETDLASRDLSWIPSVSLLTAGAGEVKENCLREADACPISARFRIQGGDVIACHLLHNEFSQLEMFKFWASGAPASDFHQAVADAARVEFEIEANEISLESWDLPRSTRKACAVLTPKNGRITLLVGNWQSPYVPKPEYPHPEHHFLSFYNLLGKEIVKRPVRRHTFRLDRGSTGLCEQDLDKFEDKLGNAWKDLPPFTQARLGPRVIPHISTECDMAQMEPPEEQ
ncbi:MAG TPA: hypothetical protein VF756_20495 [Thermoanaerobaculia bacterium]